MSNAVSYLKIHNPILIDMLISSAEGMYEVEIDSIRDMLGDQGVSTLDKKEVKESFQRVSAIQEVVQSLKHATSIPPASHKDPTWIPLSSQAQVDVADVIVDFAYDCESDMVMEPLWILRAAVERDEFHHPISVEYIDSLKAEMNKLIDRLTAITELKAIWKESQR